MSSVKSWSPVCRIILGRFNKGGCEGEKDKKKNMKCIKLRQCECCCTIIHPGQQKYGQILEIRLLRPVITSKMLDGSFFFAGYTQFHVGFDFWKKNNSFSVSLTKFWTYVNTIQTATL